MYQFRLIAKPSNVIKISDTSSAGNGNGPRENKPGHEAGVETVIGGYECQKCFSSFSSHEVTVKHVKTHNLKLPKGLSIDYLIHKVNNCRICNKRVESNVQHLCEYVCAACFNVFKSMGMYDEHVRKRHGEGLETLFFPDIANFNNWKQELEYQMQIKYNIEDAYNGKYYHHCSMRSKGNLPNFLCPSTIIAREYKNGVQVYFYKNHFRHKYRDYTLYEKYKKWHTTAIMKNHNNDMYVQLKALLDNIMIESARLNRGALSVLMGKALEMALILTNYEDDNDISINSNQSDKIYKSDKDTNIVCNSEEDIIESNTKISAIQATQNTYVPDVSFLYSTDNCYTLNKGNNLRTYSRKPVTNGSFGGTQKLNNNNKNNSEVSPQHFDNSQVSEILSKTDSQTTNDLADRSQNCDNIANSKKIKSDNISKKSFREVDNLQYSDISSQTDAPPFNDFANGSHNYEDVAKYDRVKSDNISKKSLRDVDNLQCLESSTRSDPSPSKDLANRSEDNDNVANYDKVKSDIIKKSLRDVDDLQCLKTSSKTEPPPSNDLANRSQNCVNVVNYDELKSDITKKSLRDDDDLPCLKPSSKTNPQPSKDLANGPQKYNKVANYDNVNSDNNKNKLQNVSEVKRLENSSKTVRPPPNVLANGLQNYIIVANYGEMKSGNNSIKLLQDIDDLRHLQTLNVTDQTSNDLANSYVPIANADTMKAYNNSFASFIAKNYKKKRMIDTNTPCLNSNSDTRESVITRSMSNQTSNTSSQNIYSDQSKNCSSIQNKNSKDSFKICNQSNGKSKNYSNGINNESAEIKTNEELNMKTENDDEKLQREVENVLEDENMDINLSNNNGLMPVAKNNKNYVKVVFAVDKDGNHIHNEVNNSLKRYLKANWKSDEAKRTKFSDDSKPSSSSKQSLNAHKIKERHYDQIKHDEDTQSVQNDIINITDAAENLQHQNEISHHSESEIEIKEERPDDDDIVTKKDSCDKTKDKTQFCPKISVRKFALERPRVDLEYEVKEQETDCNILVLKI